MTKPLILYNQHPREKSAKAVALALKKEYDNRVDFIEFDYHKALKDFEIPSTTSENDRFVDEYLSFLKPESESKGFVDQVYVFFRKYPSLLKQIHESDGRRYREVGVEYVRNWKREFEEGGIIREYHMNINRYEETIGAGRICFNIHNGAFCLLREGLNLKKNEGLLIYSPHQHIVTEAFENVKLEGDVSVRILPQDFDPNSITIELLEPHTFSKHFESRKKFAAFMRFVDKHLAMLKMAAANFRGSIDKTYVYATHNSFHVLEESIYTPAYLEVMKQVLDKILQ